MPRKSSNVRLLRPADAEAVVALDRRRSGRSRAGFYSRRFQALAGDSRAFVAVGAEQDRELAGFAFARILDGEFGSAAPVGVLDAIGVLPQAERAGLATGLLAALTKELSERGAGELRTQADWTEHGMAGFLSASGFRLSPRVVLERALDVPAGDDPDAEELPVRSMAEADLGEIIRLDRKITGRDRTGYLSRKAREVLRESGIRVSLVAEREGRLAGFLMARLDYGEFGRTEPAAILDTIGVDPAQGRRKIGRALLGQLLQNLESLRVERVLTEVEWDRLPLLGFLERAGFRHAQRLAFEKIIA